MTSTLDSERPKYGPKQLKKNMAVRGRAQRRQIQAAGKQLVKYSGGNEEPSSLVGCVRDIPRTPAIELTHALKLSKHTLKRKSHGFGPSAVDDNCSGEITGDMASPFDGWIKQAPEETKRRYVKYEEVCAVSDSIAAGLCSTHFPLTLLDRGSKHGHDWKSLDGIFVEVLL
jgi:hypothetical protein